MGLDKGTKARLDREFAREREENGKYDGFLSGPAANIAPDTRRAVLHIGELNAMRLPVVEGPKMKEQLPNRLPLEEFAPFIKAGVPPRAIIEANQWFKMEEE